MPHGFVECLRRCKSNDVTDTPANNQHVMQTRSGPLKPVTNRVYSSSSTAEAKLVENGDQCMSFLPFVTRFQMIQNDTVCDVTTDATWGNRDIKHFNADRDYVEDLKDIIPIPTSSDIPVLSLEDCAELNTFSEHGVNNEGPSDSLFDDSGNSLPDLLMPKVESSEPSIDNHNTNNNNSVSAVNINKKNSNSTAINYEDIGTIVSLTPKQEEEPQVTKFVEFDPVSHPIASEQIVSPVLEPVKTENQIQPQIFSVINGDLTPINLSQTSSDSVVVTQVNASPIVVCTPNSEPQVSLLNMNLQNGSSLLKQGSTSAPAVPITIAPTLAPGPAPVPTIPAPGPLHIINDITIPSPSRSPIVRERFPTKSLFVPSPSRQPIKIAPVSEANPHYDRDRELKQFIDDIRYTCLDSQGKQAIRCSMCTKIYLTEEAFRAHASNHFKSTNICSVCNKQFSRSWLLKGHMRTHTGERPFACTYEGCNKAFADRSNLRSHLLIHYPTNGKGYNCPRCNRTFSQKRYLHKHTQEVCKGNSPKPKPSSTAPKLNTE